MPIPSNTVSRMSCLANPSACCSSVRYARDIAINFQQCRHQFYCIDIKYPQIFAHPLLFRCSNQGGQLTIRRPDWTQVEKHFLGELGLTRIYPPDTNPDQPLEDLQKDIAARREKKNGKD